eukprot:TRINITY_DN95127_c0_g1_i1.p1 TRINITY_DN95127_c0_g1~~TRINITY_DN95127_c0_g1_i1.p1  ORF type:complete len:268 (+),score=59.51 TRINITY_DN95127_c0_g1_i1:15-818(+)
MSCNDDSSDADSCHEAAIIYKEVAKRRGAKHQASHEKHMVWDLEESSCGSTSSSTRFKRPMRVSTQLLENMGGYAPKHVCWSSSSGVAIVVQPGGPSHVSADTKAPLKSLFSSVAASSTRAGLSGESATYTSGAEADLDMGHFESCGGESSRSFGETNLDGGEACQRESKGSVEANDVKRILSSCVPKRRSREVKEKVSVLAQKLALQSKKRTPRTHSYSKTSQAAAQPGTKNVLHTVWDSPIRSEDEEESSAYTADDVCRGSRISL